MECVHCKKICKNDNSLRNHQRLCGSNPNRQFTKFNDPVFQKSKNGNASNVYIKAKKLGIDIPPNPRKGKPGKSVPHTPESKLKLSQHAKNRGLGGITQSRWIRYKGKTLGSSYELKLVESLDEHNIRWDTCKKINYIDPTGKHRTYTPDIYLIDYDVYLDPKNDFLINNINPNLGFSDKEKIRLVEEQNKIKVFILNKSQLSWEYVEKLLL